MRQRTILFLLLGIMVFVGSLLLSTPTSSVDSIEKRFHEWQSNYAEHIEKTVTRLQKDSLLVAECIQAPENCSLLKTLDKEVESLLVYSAENNLLYWSNDVLPSPEKLSVDKLGVFWETDKPYLLKKIGESSDKALYLLNSPGRELDLKFNWDAEDTKYKFQKRPSNFPLLNNNGNALFFLDLDHLPQDGFNHWMAFILYSISLICLFLGVFFLVELIFSDQSKSIRVFYSIFGFIILRFLTAIIFYRGISTDIYNQSIEADSGLINLGVLWINILLFYACVILITRRLHFEIRSIYKRWTRFIIYGISYLTIIISCLLIAFVGKSIIFNSGLGANLARIGDWNVGSVISLTAFIIFIVTVFHLAWYLLKSISSIHLSLPDKMLAMLLACVVSLSIYPLISIQLHPFPFYLIAILFVFLMDLFVDEDQLNLNWLFIWIAIASACSTSILYKYYIDKINTQQESLLLSVAYSRTLPVSQQKKIKAPRGTNIDYAVYFKGKREDYEGEYYPLVYPYDSEIESKKIISVQRDKRYETIYRANRDTIIVSSRIKNSFITPISWYAYVFVIWIIITTVIALLNTRWEFLPADWNFRLTQFPTLRRRIQFNIMMITIGSFAAVCLVSYLYLKSTASNEIEHEAKNKLSILIDDIESQLQLTARVPHHKLLADVSKRAEMHRTKVNLYDTNGKAIFSDNNSDIYRIAYKDWQEVSQIGTSKTFSKLHKSGEILSPLTAGNGDVLAYIGYSLSSNPVSGPYNNFLNTLLKLYIFLGVIALAVSLVVSNSITNPLKSLGDKLKEFKLGKKNQRITWNNPDELGELINNYNLMIDKLERSAEILAAQERDTAWREMAKQVAHEIKNPLTPMKLSIQHLQFTMSNDPVKGQDLVRQVTETLIEQIDNLSRIASGFSNFAKMPSAENTKLSLNHIVMHVHDLFRKRGDMNIELNLPINDIIVFADKDQVSRIVTNLLKNAIQAIPRERQGHIVINLYAQDNNAIISIEDNGSGIPEDMRDRIFEPNFTSKTSGTGLGLAMCANMVEGFNGKIYYETEVDVGSTFYVEIPLMHREEKDRIYL